MSYFSSIFPVVPSVSLRTQHIYSFVYFCVVFFIDLFTRFGGLSLVTYKTLSMCLRTYIVVLLFRDLHLPHYQCLFLAYYIYSDVYFLCRTRQPIITNVLFWRTVEMYISIIVMVLFNFILLVNILCGIWQ